MGNNVGVIRLDLIGGGVRPSPSGNILPLLVQRQYPIVLKTGGNIGEVQVTWDPAATVNLLISNSTSSPALISKITSAWGVFVSGVGVAVGGGVGVSGATTGVLVS